MRGRGLIALSVVLTGCGSHSVYNNPFAYAPKTYTTPWIPEKAYAVPEFLRPQLLLPDAEGVVSLAEIINLSLANNPETQLTWARAREAAASYAISLSDYMPEVDFTGELVYQHGQVEGGTSTLFFATVNNEMLWGPNVSLSYVLWDFGQRSAKADSTHQALYYANWMHNEEIQKVMNTVMTLYYDHLYQKEELVALQADLKDALTTYQAAEDKLRTGVDDLSAMLQAKTKYLSKQLAVTKQVETVENTYVDLLKGMGIPPNLTLEFGLFPQHPALDTLSTDADTLLGIAETMRPEILAAKAQVKAGEADLAYAKAQLFPTLSTDMNIAEVWNNQISPRASTTYSAQLNITYPLFAGFKYMNQIRKQEANLQKIRAQLTQTQLTVNQEVMTYYNAFNAAKRLIVFAADYLRASEDDYTAILANYERGTNTILDVLTAQASLADARSQYIETKKRLFTAIANLAYATGTLHNKDTP